MFTELSALLRKGDTLVLNVSRESDTELRVTVTPKLFTLDGEHGPDRKALNQPLVIVGSVAELDSPEFAATLDRYTASTNSCRQTIDDIEAAHKHHKETKIAKKPAGRASSPSAPSDKS